MIRVGRVIALASLPLLGFPGLAGAIGPNLVFNPDFSLGNDGWSGGTVVQDPLNPSHGNVLYISATPSGGYSHATQTIQGDTPPDSVIVRFDVHGDLASDGPPWLMVSLGGIGLFGYNSPGLSSTFGVWSYSSHNPALLNLHDPVLDFAVDAGTASHVALYIDNVTVASLPEPATGLIGAFSLIGLSCRRRSSRKGLPISSSTSDT